jgi:hypothetical protein
VKQIIIKMCRLKIAIISFGVIPAAPAPPPNPEGCPPPKPPLIGGLDIVFIEALVKSAIIAP